MEALELRVLAIKADDAWHNLATRIWLRSTAPDAPRSEWITTDLVLAERHVMRRDELRAVLTNVAGGQLTLGTTSILYQDTSTGSTPLPLHRWYDWTYRDTDPGNEWLRPYGGRVLHALATTASTLWGRLPNGRQALDRLADTLTPRPFRGFHELARHATGSPPFVPDRDQVGIMVFAPYEVRFVPDAWRWVDGRLSGRLVSTNPRAHPATKVLAFPPAGVTQDLSVTPGASWTEERPGEWHQRLRSIPRAFSP